FSVKGEGGMLKLEVVADAAAGNRHVHLVPTFDLKTEPATVTMASDSPGDNLIAAGIGPGPARAAMGRVNPFIVHAGGGTAGLGGTSTAEGKLHMVLDVISPQLAAGVPEFATGTSLALQIPLTGTVEQPTLDLEAMLHALPAGPAAKLRDWINRQQAAIRARD